jgi:mannose-6-phosphate isomerase-like protein (cupin superfamily)
LTDKAVRENWLVGMAATLRRLDDNRGPETKPYEVVMRHGTMHVGLYAPRGTDPQQPHAQDEVYVVMRGRGEFECGDSKRPFGEGDVLFVPAGMTHRFVDFSDDFAAWVVFYGPEGGENE